MYKIHENKNKNKKKTKNKKKQNKKKKEQTNKQKQLETIKFMKKFTSQNDNIIAISLQPKCLIINLEIKKSILSMELGIQTCRIKLDKTTQNNPKPTLNNTVIN